MKIVVNRCFGGFNLSVAAQLRILELEKIEAFPFVKEHLYENDCYVFEKYDGDNFNSDSFRFDVSFFKTKPEFDSFSMSIEDYFRGDSSEEIFLNLDYDKSYKRNDKNLVRVVEELGEAANSRHSDLKIVEIPDGHEYKIHEYDGFETVYHGIELGEI